MFHHQSALLSLGIAIAVMQVTAAAVLGKKKGYFQKSTCGRSPSSRSSQKKCPVTERSFQKDLQDIVETKSPRAWKFCAKSLESAGNKKTLRNGHNSGKKKDNFELRTKIVPWEPRPKHFRVAESLPRPQLVIHPWRIYPSYGHWDDHFDDGYIRHHALNGLRRILSTCPVTVCLTEIMTGGRQRSERKRQRDIQTEREGETQRGGGGGVRGPWCLSTHHTLVVRHMLSEHFSSDVLT